jgi:hypothetical protein
MGVDSLYEIKASTLAAQIKSFSERPLSACVVYLTKQWL